MFMHKILELKVILQKKKKMHAPCAHLSEFNNSKDYLPSRVKNHLVQKAVSVIAEDKGLNCTLWALGRFVCMV